MKKIQKRSDWILPGKLDVGFLVLVLVLLTIGLLMLFSASYPYAEAYFNDSYHFILRQSVFAAVGIVGMLIISRFNFNKYKKFAWILYIVINVILLILLILPAQIMGVKRWLVIGSFSFQPSEIAKFSVILLFSALIAKHHKEMEDAKVNTMEGAEVYNYILKQMVLHADKRVLNEIAEALSTEQLEQIVSIAKSKGI